MVRILTIDNELESAESLGFPTTLDLGPETDDLVIRWGNSTLYGDREFSRVVNPAKAIKLNVHKLDALRKLSSVVDTPRAFVTKVPNNVTALVRSIDHGDDFNVVKGPYQVPQGRYATTWIKTDVEYRVWFAWDKTTVAKRVPIRGDEEQAAQVNDEFPCRREWGYKFLDTVPQKLHNDVLRASRAIGLSLGAADVLVKGNRFIFVELNSAPSIDHPRLREFYQRHINHRCRQPVAQLAQV